MDDRAGDQEVGSCEREERKSEEDEGKVQGPGIVDSHLAFYVV